MSQVLRSPVTGHALLLIPRTGSHSIALSAMRAFWPEIPVLDEGHPAWYFGVQQNWPEDGHDCAIVVRNPVERFRSMIAHRHLDVNDQLANPIYGPLPQGEFARYFKFERDLDLVAEWLGLPLPLPVEDATDEADKPILTPEQEARVREIYSNDIKLWESL